MTMNPRPSFFDRLFGPGTINAWGQRATWETQKATWKVQRQAQRMAWKVQCDAHRAAWNTQSQVDRWRYRGPIAALWGLAWTVFWVGFALLLVVSPEFRSRALHFLLAIPQYVVHALYQVAGRSEI